MENVADGIQLEVDRGPNWLFVKLHTGKRGVLDSPLLADELWSVCEKHFIYRVVLELDDVESLPESMMVQLVMLQTRLVGRGGSLKICGLSEKGQRTLHQCRLDRALPNHASRVAAVLGDSMLAPQADHERDVASPKATTSQRTATRKRTTAPSTKKTPTIRLT